MHGFAPPLILLPFGLVALAIMSIVIGATLEKRFGETALTIGGWGSLICCYAFCAFVAFGFLAGILHLRTWLAVVIAVPLAWPILYALGKFGEQ